MKRSLESDGARPPLGRTPDEGSTFRFTLLAVDTTDANETRSRPGDPNPEYRSNIDRMAIVTNAYPYNGRYGYRNTNATFIT